MNDFAKNVVVIGAGVTGLESAAQLEMLGYEVVLIEKELVTGGHVKQWKKTFPYLKDSDAITEFTDRALDLKNVQLHTGTNVTFVEKVQSKFKIITDKNLQLNADAVLIANGFDVFDAHRKEEYGYGIFNHVISNADLEHYFKSGWPTDGNKPNRFGFIHCVGSRDAKTGNLYCSKVCCATAVKQAIEVKEHFPNAEIFCFYMDLRMFGKHYEELFQEAQEKYGIQFIRARLSEVNQNFDNTLLIKVEDTLTSRPMKLTLDYIVLMSGMEPSVHTRKIAEMFGLNTDDNGFYKSLSYATHENQTNIEGVFVAGAATGPKTIAESINDARSAALSIHDYLSNVTD